MSVVWHYVTGGVDSDITDHVRRDTTDAGENAEEANPDMVTLVVDDANLSLDFIGWQRIYALESDSTDADDVIFGGYVAEQVISRGESWLQRIWTLSLLDANALWDMRVMRTGANRPRETDVARMQWLLGTAEASEFDDVTTYVDTANPVNMDAQDYRGQTFGNVADDCSRASLKNRWVKYMRLGGTLKTVAWYGADSA